MFCHHLPHNCISFDRRFPLCLTGADERTELWRICDHANGHVHESRSLSESREQGPARKYKTSGTRHSSLASQNEGETFLKWRIMGERRHFQKKKRKKKIITIILDASCFAIVVYQTVLNSCSFLKSVMLTKHGFSFVFVFSCLALKKILICKIVFESIHILCVFILANVMWIILLAAHWCTFLVYISEQ